MSREDGAETTCSSEVVAMDDGSNPPKSPPECQGCTRLQEMLSSMIMEQRAREKLLLDRIASLDEQLSRIQLALPTSGHILGVSAEEKNKKKKKK